MQGDKWSGYCWLDPKDVFEFLGFDDKHILSPAAKQIMEWFLDRLHLNCSYSNGHGVMGDLARRFALIEIQEMCDNYGDITVNYNDIFSENFRT